MKIKKGDTVIVRGGKDKGKEGVVLRAFPKKSMVLVEGVHVVTKHQKSRRRNSKGELVHKPMPVAVSSVGLKDPKTGKAARVGYKVEGEGKAAKKVRILKQSGEKV
jgi:large subunit ribosomal protein L24